LGITLCLENIEFRPQFIIFDLKAGKKTCTIDARFMLPNIVIEHARVKYKRA